MDISQLWCHEIPLDHDAYSMSPLDHDAYSMGPLDHVMHTVWAQAKYTKSIFLSICT